MKTLILIVTFLCTTALCAQQKGVIQGTITDTAMGEEPMLFANVQLKGSATAYQTNFHGNFNIEDVATGNYILIVSYPGYETKEVPLRIEENKTLEINTNLSPIQISFANVAGMDTKTEALQAGLEAIALKE